MTLDLDDRITARAAALAMRVPESTVRSWIARGHLRPVGTDRRGRATYTARSVIEVERATRTARRGRPRAA